MSKNNFYVYALLDPRKPGPYYYGNWKFDFEPFYIGKGCGRRAVKHLNTASVHTRNAFKNNLVKKILLEYDTVPIRYIRHSLEEGTALDLEGHLIQKIGRRTVKLGPLTNLTDGGEGVSGLVWSDKARNKQAETSKLVHAAMTDAQREAKAIKVSQQVLEWHANMTCAEKKAFGESISNGYAKTRLAATKKEKQDSFERRSNAIRASCARHTKEKKEEIARKIAKTVSENYAKLPKKAKLELAARRGIGIRRSHTLKTPEEKLEWRKAISRGLLNSKKLAAQKKETKKRNTNAGRRTSVAKHKFEPI